eukprot:scaffold12273_cov29-Prasinocladus_malaysianus.AAC.1
MSIAHVDSKVRRRCLRLMLHACLLSRSHGGDIYLTLKVRFHSDLTRLRSSNPLAAVLSFHSI